MYSFPYLEPVCCSMSSSNCCFLTCIQISQQAGQVVWYSCLVKNFPHFVVTHTVKSFGIVNKADVFAFSMTLRMLAIWSLVPLPFLNPAWTSESSWFTYCWSLAWRILGYTKYLCSLKIHMLKPNPHSDGIWRWGLWEVTCYLMNSWMRLVPL